MEEEKDKMIVFNEKKIRRVWHEDDWHFCVADVVSALIESRDIKQYINKMRQRDFELSKKWGAIYTPVEMVARDCKKRLINCSNKEGIFYD